MNPAKSGTKATACYELEVPAGGCEVVRLRLTRGAAGAAFGAAFDEVLQQRLSDADEFYDRIAPNSLDQDQRRVHRPGPRGCCGRSSTTTSIWIGG